MLSVKVVSASVLAVIVARLTSVFFLLCKMPFTWEVVLYLEVNCIQLNFSSYRKASSITEHVNRNRAVTKRNKLGGL